ncbi:MAG TPA: lysophospholipid acyltransferase family protein [Noviherbaspirillum sp.]
MTSRAMRTAVTISCFIAFGAGGTLLSALFFPLLGLLPGSRRRKHERARTVVGFFFRLLIRVLEKTGCMRLETSGLDRLDNASGALILANHPSYIDVVALISVIPHANCVVKGDLWRNPFYWSIVRAAGYINNTSPEAVIESCAKVLEAKEPLILFPEGTRTPPGQAPRFQRGAARVALQANATVVPVLITCEPRTLAKGDRWWLAPERPFTFRIEVREPVPTIFFMPAAENSAISARRFTEALQQYFSRELNEHGYA